mmetsp:Transcript_25434/g.49812  ORF Transcript_25434/g.49812 Transcript_25434/m.49812 type:complete len:123 (-) Transcript_25434:1504-1872(-)
MATPLKKKVTVMVMQAMLARTWQRAPMKWNRAIPVANWQASGDAKEAKVFFSREMLKGAPMHQPTMNLPAAGKVVVIEGKASIEAKLAKERVAEEESRASGETPGVVVADQPRRRVNCIRMI